MKYGSRGSLVQLLQSALNRYGPAALAVDGIYGPLTRNAVYHFQTDKGLNPTGIADSYTHRALLPWYTGYIIHTIVPGDTFYLLGKKYKSTVSAIQTANPNLEAENLQIGTRVIIPLGFDVVPEGVDCSSQLVAFCVQGLAARYPFISRGEIGKSVMGKPIWSITMGKGENRVMYNASHHANEWINSLLLLTFTEELCQTYAENGSIEGISARELLEFSTIMLIPAVNPDGIDLVTGALDSGEFYIGAQRIAADYPQFAFPDGWNANIRGVDLNLQYPASWEKAKEIRFGQGFVSPAPGFYVGRKPLCAPESYAMYQATLDFDPMLTLSYHSQGQVIYWKYLNFEPENSRKIGELFSKLSGYTLIDNAEDSGYAGYKDWFIQQFDRPGYTIETGLGSNPLPLSQLASIFEDNIGILVSAAAVN